MYFSYIKRTEIQKVVLQIVFTTESRRFLIKRSAHVLWTLTEAGVSEA